MISVPELLMSASSLFSGAEKQRLQDFEQAMTEGIMTCLL
jgi:hypothetical protein